MKAPLIFGVALLLAGCLRVDDVASRTTQMNLAIGESSNVNTLLNVVRASMSEPLSLASLTGYTGHRTRTGNFAVPGVTAAGAPLEVSQVAESGNGGTVSDSNDFTYSANDDNATYQALLQPVDPATLAYLQKQDYPRVLLLFLVISRISVEDGAGKVANYTNDIATTELGPERRLVVLKDFANQLQVLLQSGLSAQIDLTSNQLSKFCFDPTLPRPFTDREMEPGSAHDLHPSCTESVPILGGKARDAENHHVFADGFTFRDRSTGSNVRVFFRSTFGIYRYLGALYANGVDFFPFSGQYRGLAGKLVALTNQTDNCFVSVEYRGQLFCVPNDAVTTKRVFTLLHDLLRLYTFPAPTSTLPTLSARLIPG